jgi:hypothetical protein
MWLTFASTFKSPQFQSSLNFPNPLLTQASLPRPGFSTKTFLNNLYQGFHAPVCVYLRFDKSREPHFVVFLKLDQTVYPADKIREHIFQSVEPCFRCHLSDRRLSESSRRLQQIKTTGSLGTCHSQC